MIPSVSVVTRLRDRNQLTIPDSVVQAAGMTEGDRFLVEFDPAEPDTVRLHRLRASYAGSMRDVYGDAEILLLEEREGWR